MWWRPVHLIQLVSQSPLSKVPKPSTSALDCRQRARTSVDALLSCRVHAAARAAYTRLAESSGAVQPVVPHCCGNAARGRAQSQTFGCRDRLLWDPAHVGTESSVPSSYPLCHSWWRALARPLQLDSSVISFLLAGESPRKGISRQVHSRIAARFSRKAAHSCRADSALGPAETFWCVSQNAVPTRLDRLREAGIRRSRAGRALPRTLHPSSRHLESSIAFLRW